ncbi:hypothetical protein M422DRAFT_52767 [Sphaerobolus stellatus SS14]|uniref:Unplaced genomic scaffold SPHSTscaffold_149, whole genome shotgun sequence n=1 Tax=Sphaerobolus stellatus (strain SS14) TaxID=990650 RepID=A0A0C9V532_SPHS4|nr:hypothetical protein M422DRAFT_52767 [Sphaerobolus stellatus SS14]
MTGRSSQNAAQVAMGSTIRKRKALEFSENVGAGIENVTSKRARSTETAVLNKPSILGVELMANEGVKRATSAEQDVAAVKDVIRIEPTATEGATSGEGDVAAVRDVEGGMFEHTSPDSDRLQQLIATPDFAIGEPALPIVSGKRGRRGKGNAGGGGGAPRGGAPRRGRSKMATENIGTPTERLSGDGDGAMVLG